jgi:hypothetical protein
MHKRPGILQWKYLFVLIPLLVYMTSLTQYWICSDDSALYICQARSFLHTGMFMHNGEPKLAASPGFPMLIAGIMAVAGETNFFAMQLCMTLCGLAGLVIAYRQRWIWTTRFQARWVMFATAMSYVFYHNTRRVLTEAPSFLLFWVIIALLRSSKTNKWYLALVALASYAAIFTRMPATFAVTAIGVAVLFEKQLVSEKFRWRFLGSCVLATGVIAGWFHVKLISMAYQQGTPYMPSTISIINVTDTWSTIVNDIGRMFTYLGVAQRNWAAGLGGCTLLGWAGLYCYRHHARKLTFPMVFMFTQAVLLISIIGSWTMTPRYWFYILPLIIYYLFVGLELLGGLATKAIRLRKPLIPLPKFAATVICLLAMAQLPLICRSNFVSMYGWVHSQDEFYQAFDRGHSAEIMPLANELAREKSDAWIASSGRGTTLRAFSGRCVHDLIPGPLRVVDSEQWHQHPPAVILLKRPKPEQTDIMDAARIMMEHFDSDKDNWTLASKTKRWVVFKRKIAKTKPTTNRAN